MRQRGEPAGAHLARCGMDRSDDQAHARIDTQAKDDSPHVVPHRESDVRGIGPHEEKQSGHEERYAPVHDKNNGGKVLHRHLGMNDEKYRDDEKGESEDHEYADHLVRLTNLGAEDVGEDFKDDEERERVFERDGDPIRIKVVVGLRRSIQDRGQRNRAGDVKEDVSKKGGKATMYLMPEESEQEQDLEREAPKPGDEFVKVHRPPSRIYASSGDRATVILLFLDL